MRKIMLPGICLGLLLSASGFSGAKTGDEPKACGPVPSVKQLNWQKLETYAFVHFSINTYTDKSWGEGDEDPKLFNPVNLDCRQWVRTCKEAGMKAVIVTAKHHSGFCLWPSKYTEFSVKNTPWKNGKGDIMRELSDACKEYGLKLGVYLSPWDRNHAEYGRPEYITYFRNQLRELLTNYGEIFEVWFDGANGGSGYYGGARETREIDRKTYYDWKNTYKLVRELQPNAVIFNDNSDRADIRWVGTEGGFVGATNWSLLNSTGDTSYDMLHYGFQSGDTWVPSEVNASIRPEWFYHKSEDNSVKNVPQLLDIYYNSVGRNGTMLLNFPIMPNGLINKKDSLEAANFSRVVKETFAHNLAQNAKATASSVWDAQAEHGAAKAIDNNAGTYWAPTEGQTGASLTINFAKPTFLNRFLAQEYITLGQRVKTFTVEGLVDGAWKQLAEGTTIGYKRILRFPTVKASKVRLTITDAKCTPLISNVGIYLAPQVLDAPTIVRHKSGEVAIIPSDIDAKVYYTLNGSVPTTKSQLYTQPLKADGKLFVRAIAYNAMTKKTSPASEAKFYVSHKDWKVLGTDDKNADEAIDGQPYSAWSLSHKTDDGQPVDFVVDMGKEETINGFRYSPPLQSYWGGVIVDYQFFVSDDNEHWTLVSEGEFANVRNNRIEQSRNFKQVRTRYFKLRCLKNISGKSYFADYGEVDVINQ